MLFNKKGIYTIIQRFDGSKPLLFLKIIVY